MIKDKLNDLWRYMLTVSKMCLLGAFMGVIGGFLGAGFHYALQFVTGTRQENNWIIFLLPIGGILIVLLYRLLKLETNRGTNEVIDSVLEGKTVSPFVAPTIFLATAITHLFGGSAGREGAALQLGGSTASVLSRALRLKKEESSVLLICGMGAVFSGLFCMPLTACLFTLEFESVGTIFSPALLPCFIAALLANLVSTSLGVHKEAVISEKIFELNFQNSWKIVVLAVLVSLLGIVMCNTFHKAEYYAKHFISNPYLRIVAGSLIIIALTLLVGDQRFNGAGMDLAMLALEGKADWYSFLLKILFTAITLGVGFKGGEIVPTLCIGATFGCVMGTLLGMDPAFFAMLGLVGLFCSATNSPLASIALSLEMFGANNLYIFVLMCVITFVLSGNCGLYASQIFEFSKASLQKNKSIYE